MLLLEKTINSNRKSLLDPNLTRNFSTIRHREKIKVPQKDLFFCLALHPPPIMAKSQTQTQNRLLNNKQALTNRTNGLRQMIR